ncbi:RebB family R body protein [Sphingomonas sp. 28-63-12]|uniref:RebB family R body protein n=1 Tax=Sphingomonas sp. 28-63-12 TaxID=1970434 RepID=UPI000BC9FC67|nr:MAG: hypothetical protein B7Y47_12405 [Sphingomonas sp. 28-63-12]
MAESAAEGVGSALHLALGSLFSATTLAMQHAAENAAFAQQQNNRVAAAATDAGIRILNAIAAPAADSGRKEGQ